MTARPNGSSGTDVTSITEIMVGTTSEVSVKGTSAGNALTIIQMLYDIRDIRRDSTGHDATLRMITKDLEELKASAASQGAAAASLATELTQASEAIATLSTRVSHKPGKAFVLAIGLVLALVCAIGAVEFAPRIQEALGSLRLPGTR